MGISLQWSLWFHNISCTSEAVKWVKDKKNYIISCLKYIFKVEHYIHIIYISMAILYMNTIWIYTFIELLQNKYIPSTLFNFAPKIFQIINHKFLIKNLLYESIHFTCIYIFNLTVFTASRVILHIRYCCIFNSQ